MIPLGPATRVFVALEAVDMRKPKNRNEIAWIIIQLFAVVLNAGANGVFFNSPTG